ncbi:MATE family efflux transporter [Anaerorhabdus furcosa]|uniref:Putative efflux protein, MATE family n=1 Tax=Anaerorhabdus furcosa TaxID=118967 RepID=A0A1T4K0A3_9FIRM|nr:MATE family efflux transporter [Anaerorhabdus furcosa]SJZ35804.1 putative efflux protein, MATE family [Anaerorhabdus furcosa]
MEKVNKITDGIIWKQILIFFFPILLGSFFQQLYNTVDAIIVGQYVGANALAAVGGSSAQIINCLVGFFLGISSGASIIISRYYGGKNREMTSKGVHTAIALAISFGIILMFLGYFFAPTALKMMGEPAEIFTLSLDYIRIYFFGSVFSLTYNIGASILNAIGDSKKPLYFLICSTCINVVLDILFVRGFGMGVQGVAIATIISQFCSACLVLFSLSRTKDMHHFDFRKLRFDPEILRKIIYIGFPAGVQSMMYSISNIFIQSSINSFGTTTIAAYTAYGKIDGLFWMMMNAFGISAMTFAAQNFGAHKIDRVKKCVKTCLIMAAISTIVMSAFLYFSADGFYRLFTQDDSVIAIGLQMLRFLTPMYIFWVGIEILSSVVRASGDSLGPLIISAIGICLVRVLWVFFVVPTYHDIIVLIACYPVTWILCTVAFSIYYRRKQLKWY